MSKNVKPTKPSSIRKFNRNMIINTIKKCKSISMIELSKQTGLKPPAVSSIIKDLLEENILVYMGKGKTNSKGGPRPNIYTLNGSYKSFIGIEIGHNILSGVIIDFNGHVVEKKYKYIKDTTQDTLTEEIISLIHFLIDESKVDIKNLAGISLGLAALVDSKSGKIKLSGIKTLNNYDIKCILEHRFNVNVYIDNDMNVFTAGHKWVDSKQTVMKNVICFGIKKGIGVGIVIDGKIYRGSAGMAGQIGLKDYSADEYKNTQIIPSLYIDNDSIINQLKTHILNSDLDFLDKYGISSIHALTINDVYKALECGDDVVLDATKNAYHELGKLIAMFIHIFNPEGIGVVGNIFNYSNELFEYIIKSTKKYSWDMIIENVSFEKLTMDEYSIAYSAASVIMNKFYEELY